MKIRLISEVGTRSWLRTYALSDDTSLSCSAKPTNTCEAKVFFADSDKAQDWPGLQLMWMKSFDPSRYPSECDACKRPFATFPEESVNRHLLTKRLYDTSSGDPEPGDAFLSNWNHWDHDVLVRMGVPCKPTRCMSGWVDCDGKHLMVVLPDGHWWDTSGRASNCTRPLDQDHRCWVLSGEPPLITASKSGITCDAGAGSIQSPRGWHGFLVNGELRLTR